MFPQEARWLSECLQGLPVAQLSPLLNLGSSDLHFRSAVQPYIDRVLFAPLGVRGVQIVHCDLRKSAGVDISADILDDDGLARLAAVGARTIVCSNLHEHVLDPGLLARRCTELLPPGGLLLVTVPYCYPYHRDPIDTLFRPSPEILASMHPGLETISSTVLDVGSFREQLRAHPWRVLGDVRRDLVALMDTRSTAFLRIRWLNKPYLQTCLALRKPF